MSQSKRGPAGRYAHLLAVCILVLALGFYLHRIDQWFMHDDEGGYAYAAWRISLGEMPYRDFLTPQLPLFLYWGGLIIRTFGPSMVALRLVTVLTTLLAGWFFYLSARQAAGWRIALLSLPLLLIHRDIYFIARFFRPEAYMLLFVAAATYTFLVSPKWGRRRPLGVLLAGGLFGLSLLCKLFGALPAAGCGLFLLAQWLRTREKERLEDILALVAGFAAVAVPVILGFQLLEPYFLTAVVGHHAMQGAQLGALQVILKALRFYGSYFLGTPVFLLLALLGAAATLRASAALASYYAWQIPTVAAFLVLSRDLADRHLVYLVPALAVLAAQALESLPQWQPLLQRAPSAAHTPAVPERSRSLLLALGLAAVVLSLWPSLLRDADVASWDEKDTRPLAAYVQSLTGPDDTVLADYPSINFFAQRKNTYLGAGISGGATSSGQITGHALLGEIEADKVQMVLLNTAGGAHQLVNLHDYSDFRRYLQQRFHLIRMYQRSYETFEVYHLHTELPLTFDVEFGDQLSLTGADPHGATVQAGGALTVSLRWHATGAMENDYTVSLRLVDDAGHRYGQQDAPLLRTFTSRWEGPLEIIENAPTSAWPAGEVVLNDIAVSAPLATPPDLYSLTVLLYDLSTGQVLRTPRDTGESASEVLLGQVTVQRPEWPPAVDDLPMQKALMHDFGDQLRLLGQAPIPEQVRPGDALNLALFWQALQPVQEDWMLLLRLESASGQVLSEGRYALASDSHPTSQWAEGEVNLGFYDLGLDRFAPAGAAQLSLNLLRADTGQEWPEQALVLATVLIQGRPRSYEPPASMQVALSSDFGQQVRLLGYDLAPAETRPGEVVHLTLYWQALVEMPNSYTVFTHLLDAQEQIWGQLDSIPVQGTYPTTAWLPGEVIRDAYGIALSPQAPTGPYTPEIGWYDAATGERLPVVDEQGHVLGDHVLLNSFEVRE